MTDGPELSLVNVGLAFLPILALMAAILALKWSAPKAGAVAWLIAASAAFLFFGADTALLGIGSAKGLSLSLFVLSIVWTSVLLYNVIDQLGGITIIGSTMTRLAREPLVLALMVGWAFSGFMQGVSGFGVPVAVAAPLLVFAGFKPARAAAIVLVGHAWAVSFGSLGSSYYTIQLVTGIPGEQIGPHMALLFILPIVASGFAVAHIQGGMSSVRRGAPLILTVGAAMGFCTWLMAVIGAPQIASIVSGLVGCAAVWLLGRTLALYRSAAQQPDPEAAAALDASEEKAEGPTSARRQERAGAGPGFHLAFLPYYLILLLSVLTQIPGIRELGAGLQWGLDYPAAETALGFQVEGREDYARISLLRHPAPLILISLIVAYLVNVFAGRWRSGTGMSAARLTYNQCAPATMGIAMMLMMALVMTDTGMTVLLGRTIASGAGWSFPLFSPYIGVLGSFMTGSNTNSNVMFGALQIEAAAALGVNAVTVASVQSIGGSLGSAIAPAKVLVGTAVVGLSGQEGSVMRRAIPYCLGIAFLVGVQALLLTRPWEAK